MTLPPNILLKEDQASGLKLEGGVTFLALEGKLITNTLILQLPINCVLAGQQSEEKDTRFVTDPHGVLKKIIFGE